MEAILRRLVTAPAPPPVETVADWWLRHRAATAPYEVPVDRALAAGAVMDRAGWAFASGYQCALVRLFSTLSQDRMVALAATEDGGGHPRAITVSLTGQVGARTLSGRKRWVTLGPHAEVLLVVASTGMAPDGRNRLVVVQVDARAPGVTVIPGAGIPFVPEVPHGSVEFREVVVPDAAVLPGDGYADYLKPFRTVEDAHVLAALGAWFTVLARTHGWPRAVVSEMVSLLVAIRAIATADPWSPAVHIALDGALRGLLGWVSTSGAYLDALPEPERSRWVRDAAVLTVAGRVRAARAQAAWTALGGLG